LGTGNFGSFLAQLTHTVQQPQIYVETQLAAARGVPVHRGRLLPEQPMAAWEFPRAAALVERGYCIMQYYLEEHPDLNPSAVPTKKTWWQRLWSVLPAALAPAMTSNAGGLGERHLC
jgi:hypothetical protein